MKNLINIILILSFLYATISCDNKKGKIKLNKEATKIDSFEYNLKNKEKIFLDFWSGMNSDDYFKVCELLVSKKIMEDLDEYKLGDYNVELDYGNKLNYSPDSKNFFENSSNIESIYLFLESQKVVDVFIQKYKIDDLKKVYVFNYYLEKNPLYGLNPENINDKIETEVQDEPKDLNIEEFQNIAINKNSTYSMIAGGKSMNFDNMSYNPRLEDFFDSKFKYLMKKDVVIQKDKRVLIFHNSENNFDVRNPAVKYNVTSKDIYNFVDILYPEGYTESPFRIVKIRNTDNIFVTYTTKKHYDKIKLEGKIKSNQDNEKYREQKENINKRKSESLNEI